MKFTEGDCCKGFLKHRHAGRMQSGGVQVGAPRSHTAQTLAVRAAGMSCFQARKNLFQIELEVTLRYLQNPTAGAALPYK